MILSACGGSEEEGNATGTADTLRPASAVVANGTARPAVDLAGPADLADPALAAAAAFPGYQVADPRLARFNAPSGVEFDRAGNLYVADTYNHTIRKIARNGVVTTLAGLPGWPGGEDGIGAAARFSSLADIAIDRFGNLFVTDGYTIRRITPQGMVTTIAGLYKQWGYTDGHGSAARFNRPHGIALDREGNIYVADTNNARIRKITPHGVVSTVAGGDEDQGGIIDGIGGAAGFDTPWGLAADRHGRLYVTDIAYRHVPIPYSGSTFIRRIDPRNGLVVTLAGNYGIANDPPQGVRETTAAFNEAQGIVIDHGGNVYVADFYNNEGRLRRLDTRGGLSTLPLAPGTLGNPYDIALHWQGSLLVSDPQRHTIGIQLPAAPYRVFAGVSDDPGYNDTP